MQVQWDWLWLGVLLVGSVTAEIHDEEIQDADVEVEDFDKNSQETDIDKGSSSLEVMYKTPEPTGEVYFTETFDDGVLTGWLLSKTQKEDTDENISKYDGRWEVEALKENTVPGDRGLVLKSIARHHAISAMLTKPFIFDTKPLIVQYEVNFQDGIDCGGAYVKLLSGSDDLDLEHFFDKTPYTIMFGPDKCGEDYKLHFIFRHKNPKTGVYEEKHAKRPDVDLKKFYSDKKTHLYTLVLKPDDTFELLIDQSVVGKGNLLEDMVPPVNPSKEIEDPSDKKPDDWDERPKIPDPNAVKPDDWDEDEPSKIEDPDAVKPEGWLDDELQYIPDPNAEKPEDWDEEMDGEWETPQIPNPKCETAPGCGEWVRPMMTNPNYKGKWKPPMIDNPNYQPGMLSQLVTAAEDRPWLWVIYILTLALPVGLGVLFCWPSKKIEEDIDYKKTDVSKPVTKGELEQAREEIDDDEAELEEEKENEDIAIEGEGEGEDKNDDEEENEATEGSQEEGDKSNKSGSEDEMKEADESTGSGDGPMKSVRKRRVRKD